MTREFKVLLQAIPSILVFLLLMTVFYASVALFIPTLGHSYALFNKLSNHLRPYFATRLWFKWIEG